MKRATMFPHFFFFKADIFSFQRRFSCKDSLKISTTILRPIFADFTKGFDVIDHSVLLDELKSFDIDQILFFWVPVRSFLTNRVQAMRVGSSLSSWKQVNGGVRQGTILDLTLFAVMINKLLRNGHMRSKYVDAGADEQELATPILSPCHGIFTD